MHPTAGTITAPQAALLSIIAAVTYKGKKIYRFARFLLIYEKLMTACGPINLLIVQIYWTD